MSVRPCAYELVFELSKVRLILTFLSTVHAIQDNISELSRGRWHQSCFLWLLMTHELNAASFINKAGSINKWNFLIWFKWPSFKQLLTEILLNSRIHWTHCTSTPHNLIFNAICYLTGNHMFHNFFKKTNVKKKKSIMLTESV